METITISIQEYTQMKKRIEELQMLLAFMQNEAFMQQFWQFVQLMMQQNIQKNTAMQDFLLQGSTMTDQEYQQFTEKRNHFNQWNQSV